MDGFVIMFQAGVCCAVVSVRYSYVVTCWERVDLFAVVFVGFCYFHKYVLFHTRIKGEVAAMKLV